jgi:beta-lactamase superfamily II metal-dependent hydrolase
MRSAHRPAILALAILLSGLVLLGSLVVAQGRAGNGLSVYLVDVEGGNATLFVTPSGESLLIDTGNGGAAATRDVDRIMAAVKDSGISQIDHLITTHYHGDHFGGMAELASRLAIRNFIDHGPNVQPNPNTDAFLGKTYPELYAKGRHTVVKPGDRIPMMNLDVRVLTSAGEAIKTPVAGAGAPNPLCGSFKRQDVDKTENAQSVGSLITFGRFRALHLGDLTVNKEFDLMCPNNRVGAVDLFVVSHHGQPVSNAHVLVHAIRSRVAIMNNGTRKGGQPDAMRVIYSAPGLEDLWQLHFSLLSGQEYTVPGLFIANDVDEAQPTMPIAAMTPPQPGPSVPPPPVHNGPAFWIKVLAQQDGTFTVTNSRNGFSKTYAARR